VGWQPKSKSDLFVRENGGGFWMENSTLFDIWGRGTPAKKIHNKKVIKNITHMTPKLKHPFTDNTLVQFHSFICHI
jgi:hypothetical protein